MKNLDPRWFDDRPSYEPIRTKRKQQFSPPTANDSLDGMAYGDLIAIARGRVIDAFIHRTDEHRGKHKVSDKIGGVGKRWNDLAKYIANFCRAHPFVTHDHLTREMRQLPSGKQRLIIEAWQLECINEALSPLRDRAHIWFNDFDGGTWEIEQHLRDERAFRPKMMYNPFEERYTA